MASVSERVAALERRRCDLGQVPTEEIRDRLRGMLVRSLAAEGRTCAEIAAELSLSVVRVWGALRG